MPSSSPLPTAADALHALPGVPGPGASPASAWPAAHRMLATVAGMLLCLLAGLGCAESRSAGAVPAVAPTYSHLQHATPEARRGLWMPSPARGTTLLAGSAPRD